eukprot:3455710-Prorocentrum_lima.AAC.1
MSAAIDDLLRGAPLPHSLTDAIATLVPKVLNPTHLSKFRPISATSASRKLWDGVLLQQWTPPPSL